MLRNLLTISIFLFFFSCGERFSLYPIPDFAISTDDQIQAVESFLDEQMRKHPDNVDLGIQKLRLSQSRDWQDDSESLIQHMIDRDSSNFVVRELAADYYLNRSMISTALRHANKAEELGAKSASFYRLKALLFSRLNKYDEAIDYTNKAILINRSDYNSYYTKGHIYLNLKDTVSALRFMEMSLKQDRTNHDILYEICGIYQKKNEFIKAKSLINEAILRAPDEEHLQLRKASIMIQMSDHDNAKKTLWNSFYKTSNNLESGLILGQTYFDLKQYDSAIVMSDLMIQRDTMFIDAILLKARAYNSKYFLTNALKNYQKLLSIDSTHQEGQEEMQKVIGKIAYLRRLKEAKESMPVFDIVAPKKN